VIWLLAMTGIRRAELIGLRWRDVDLDLRVVRVVDGKGGKGREVPLPHPLARLLADHRPRCSEHGIGERDHFVCCRRYEYSAGRLGKRLERVEPDRPMGHSTPEKILHRVAALVGIPDPEHVSPHDLRRAYATAS
jgi:integrase